GPGHPAGPSRASRALSSAAYAARLPGTPVGRAMMSNALALAATLRVIASLIDDNITRANVVLLGAPHTTVSAPDLIHLGGNRETDHLNLFLYTVTMNSGWRNIAAVRNGAGERIARPPLAVDLHFLLSAYGSHQYHPEMLLGIGMQALHEHPFLDRGSIQ